ncbi:GntR family transcriptional regulator [Micrococcus luteus]|uniref:GntR family transcriptional regulator n=1 Tax=Micrococcus luteus TaxID=1270 RepID=UPI00369457E1
MTSLSDSLWGSRATAAGRLAHDVAWRIVRGEIAAGEMLTEVQLSTEAGISRTPAREALLQLERWGLVRLLPKKGAAVQALTPQSVADLTALRGLLESTALATVAVRPDAGGPLVATLTANLEQQRAALDAGDLAAFSALDVRFHRDVIATCGNAAFDEVVRTFAPRLARLIHAATGGSVDAARRLLDGHVEICAQLAAGRAADAQRALQAHLDTAGTGVVVPGLPTVGPSEAGELR